MRVLITRRLAIDPRPLLGPEAVIDQLEGERAPVRELLLERARESHALLSMVVDKIDAELLDQSPLLRIVANHAVGVDNIDVPACTARGVQVTNTPDVLTDSTADLTWTLLLAVARRLREGERLLREGRFLGWTPTLLLGLELNGATLGVHGFGRIGQAVARRAAGFGMRVVFHSRSQVPQALAQSLHARQVPFNELLASSDIISIHCPSTPETLHAYGARQFAAMKRGAILINTARGPIVDEAALVAALEAGTLGGAGLDVFEREPLVNPALLGRDDVVLLPHLGSATQATRARMATLALTDIARVLRGERPLHPVNQPLP